MNAEQKHIPEMKTKRHKLNCESTKKKKKIEGKGWERYLIDWKLGLKKLGAPESGIYLRFAVLDPT